MCNIDTKLNATNKLVNTITKNINSDNNIIDLDTFEFDNIPCLKINGEYIDNIDSLNIHYSKLDGSLSNNNYRLKYYKNNKLVTINKTSNKKITLEEYI